MGYRNKKPQLIMFDAFFTSACPLNEQTADEDRCKSKSKNKDEPGLCAVYDCPFVYEADLKEIKKHDHRLYDEHRDYFEEKIKNGMEEEDCCPSLEYGSNWVIEYRTAANT